MGVRAIIPALVLAALPALGACSPDTGPGHHDGGGGDGDADLDVDADGDADGDSDVDADRGEDADEECFENIDVVFVLDVSTSMGYILSTLEEEIGHVWTAAAEIDDTPHFGLVVFVDDVLVSNEGHTYDTVDAIQADFHRWYQHTSTNQQTRSGASNTDWPENSLDALVAAATDFEWRDSATTVRVVIHATDDTFLERPARFESGIAAEHTYDETVAILQEHLVRVGSFAAHIGGQFDDQNVEAGFFTEYRGQRAIPEAASGRAYDIDEVGDAISLADAISGFVLDEVCEAYVVY